MATLLGVDILVKVMLPGRWREIPNSPFSFETELGWVLAGGTDSCAPVYHVATHHASLLTGDDLLRQFWEVEKNSKAHSTLSPEYQSVLDHFKTHTLARVKVDSLYLHPKCLVSNHLVSPGDKQSEDFFHLNDRFIPRVSFKS